jgi:hypothetical protein
MNVELDTCQNSCRNGRISTLATAKFTILPKILLKWQDWGLELDHKTKSSQQSGRSGSVPDGKGGRIE